MKKTTGLKDMKQRKRKIVALVATVMALGGVGTVMAVNQGTLAYFTDYDHEKNIFTTGKVDIDLTEPNWPGNQENVVPGDIFTKDPTITNKDSVPVCAYLQVKVPVANVTMVNDDGSRTPKADHQLLTYGCGETADTVSGTEVALDAKHGLVANINNNKADGWTLVKSEETTTGIAGAVKRYNVYTYSYNSVLEQGDVTTALFSKVRMMNVIEGELDNTVLEMPIKAYAIQAAHTGTAPSTPDDGNDYPTTVEEVQKEAKEAYEKYLKQNTGLGVQDAGKDAVVLDSEETVSELQVG